MRKNNIIFYGFLIMLSSCGVEGVMLNEYPFLMAHDAASGYLDRSHVGG